MTNKKSLDIILRDSSINAFCEIRSIINVLINYEQSDKDSNYTYGSLLDYLHIHQEFLKELNTDCKVTNDSFSDHDEVKLKVTIFNTVST